MRDISLCIIIKSLEWVYARLMNPISVPVFQSVGPKSFQGITISDVVGFRYTSVDPVPGWLDYDAIKKVNIMTL